MKDKQVIHYGVKGMKWGIRKDRKSTTKGLSNAQLRERVERMQLEQRYNRLLADEQSKGFIASGKATVASIVGNAAKQAATNYLARQFGDVIEKVAG